ncbi:MAG: redox-sensing transcriptional repressor Rex [candidate division NC10 bacterium]|nr:redox-sensing transcriptional repressor Rex [candidate division NC10 bacterium]
MKSSKIPERTITRLSIYLRCLEELEADGIVSISSKQLAERFGLNPAQVRKDLAYFGQFGIRGLGYPTQELKNHLERILGLKQDWEVALVGLGNLGSALLHYKGFRERGFKITAIFDKDPVKVGRRVKGVRVWNVSWIVPVIKRRKIKIAILAIPTVGAQAVVDGLVEAGVTAILNFAPTQLSVPWNVKLQNVDISVLLKTLSFHTIRADREATRTEGAS